MKALLPILITLTATFLFAQNNIPVFDGIVNHEGQYKTEKLVSINPLLLIHETVTPNKSKNCKLFL